MSSIRLKDLPDVPALIIRISREWRPNLSEEQLYERTRRYWRITPEKRRVRPVLAYCLADGAIQAVYWIEGWERYDMANEQKRPDRSDRTPHGDGIRYGLLGRPALEYAGLIGRPILDPPKGQNPCTYFRC